MSRWMKRQSTMRERIGTLPVRFPTSTSAFSTHASSPLPGYTFETDIGRYRSGATGKFVSRKDILGLLEAQSNAVEVRVGELTNAVMEGRISTVVWQEQLRTEVKRQVL